MTALSSANPCWPPPPVGPARRARRARRTVGVTTIEDAVDTAPDDAPRAWFRHPLVTLAAFLVFPPLGLWLAIRHHGLWRQGLAVRIAVLAVTLALLVPLITGTGASDSARSGIQDGAPIVGNLDSAPASDPTGEPAQPTLVHPATTPHAPAPSL